MEGQVYLCSWKKVGSLIKVWVKNKPKLQVTGSSFGIADGELADQILCAFGDGENVREYVTPPKTLSKAGRLDLDIVQINGNSHLPIESDPAMLFSGGMCKKCGSLLGKRSDVPLTLRCSSAGYETGFVWQKPFEFFSESFLKLLKPKERSAFDWRPVHFKKRSRKAFYEIRPRTIVPLVAVKGMKFSAIRCKSCKTLRGLHCFSQDTPIYKYISASDLSKPVPSCFVIGLPASFNLCFTRKRWLELVGKPGTKGLVSTPIGVVDESICQRVRT